MCTKDDSDSERSAERGSDCSRECEDDDLAQHESIRNAIGGDKEASRHVLRLLEESFNSGVLDLSSLKCSDILGSWIDATCEREGKDGAIHHVVKTISTMLRLKGFDGRNTSPEFHTIDLSGHPLFAMATLNHRGHAKPGKVECLFRSIELLVHLVRSCNNVSTVRLSECELGPHGGENGLTEVSRLMRTLGIGRNARFLGELDLRGNCMDAASVKKLVEAAVKERARIKSSSAVPLWLDLSDNYVRNAESVFQNLQASVGWNHNCDTALCLADKDGCSKTQCPVNCMLHLPRFLQQRKPEAKQTDESCLTLAIPERANSVRQQSSSGTANLVDSALDLNQSTHQADQRKQSQISHMKKSSLHSRSRSRHRRQSSSRHRRRARHSRGRRRSTSRRHGGRRRRSRTPKRSTDDRIAVSNGPEPVPLAPHYGFGNPYEPVPPVHSWSPYACHDWRVVAGSWQQPQWSPGMWPTEQR